MVSSVSTICFIGSTTLSGQEVEIQHDEASITVWKGKKTVAILDKAKDVFNPTVQGASTQEPKKGAFEKQSFRSDTRCKDIVIWRLGESSSMS